MSHTPGLDLQEDIADLDSFSGLQDFTAQTDLSESDSDQIDEMATSQYVLSEQQFQQLTSTRPKSSHKTATKPSSQAPENRP